MKATLLPLALAASTLAPAAAFSALAPPSSSILSGLQTAPLVRASDNASVLLPNEWRSNTPFGLADEIAVVAFLRHYG